MRPGHEDADFFTGVEVEHSIAFGMKTLFIVGCKSIDQIEAKISYCNNFKIEHLYFGANQSFQIADTSTYEIWYEWTRTIKHFLNKGFWCTLDLDIRYLEELHETGLCEFNTFIPMISVPLPHIRLLNYNAILKLDDKSMAYSNPGVWCHRIHDLQNNSVFTDWSKYSSDTVLN